MSSRRTLHSATLLATIAFALTACGPLTSASEQEAAEATTEANAAQDAAEGSAEPADVESEEAATVAPATEVSDTSDSDTSDSDTSDSASTEPVSSDAGSTDAPEPAEAAPAPVVPEHRRCTVPQGADGLDYVVDGIRHDDPDGGLTGRINAGYSYESVGLLPEGTIVGSYADEAGFPSCLITRDGGIWWEIYSADLSMTLWVNSMYLIEYNGPVPGYPEGEADVHTDCVYLPDLPETCIVVYTSGGVIMGADYDNAEAFELIYACIFQEFGPACDVLASTDPDTDVNAQLRSKPLDTIRLECDEGVGVLQKLACAELGRRL